MPTKASFYGYKSSGAPKKKASPKPAPTTASGYGYTSKGSPTKSSPVRRTSGGGNSGWTPTASTSTVGSSGGGGGGSATVSRATQRKVHRQATVAKAKARVVSDVRKSLRHEDPFKEKSESFLARRAQTKVEDLWVHKKRKSASLAGEAPPNLLKMSAARLPKQQGLEKRLLKTVERTPIQRSPQAPKPKSRPNLNRGALPDFLDNKNSKARTLHNERRKFMKWSKTPEEKRGSYPTHRKDGVSSFEWLNKHDRKYSYVEDGGRVGKDAAKRAKKQWSDPKLIERAEPRIKKLYKKAKKVTGLPGKAPEVRYNVGRVDRGNNAAFVQNGKVSLGTGLTTEVGAPHSMWKLDDSARRTLLHEFAHTQQTTHGSPTKEGGAELFAKVASRRLGVDKTSSPTKEYARFAKSTKDKRGKQFASKGQFRGGTPPDKPAESPKKKTPKKKPSKHEALLALKGSKDPKKPASKRNLEVTSKKTQKKVATKLKAAAKKSTAGLAEELNRGFKPGEEITPEQVAIIAESVGLPGITYEQVDQGEGLHQPGIPNPDDGYPGLWQRTPSVQSPEMVARWNEIASKYPGGPTNPIAAAKQIKALVGDDPVGGLSNFYGDQYVTDTNAHLPGGQAAAKRKLYGNPKPIPKGLQKKAADILGGKKAKKIVKKATSSGTTAAPKQKPGGWAGSKTAALKMIPKAARPEGRHDKRTPSENASVGGAADSDHLTTNTSAYGADIDPDPKVYNEIQKKLGLPITATGEQSIVKDGYRYQLIFGAEYGHDDHIHLGAEWVGEGTPEGTVTGSVGTGAGGSALTSTTGATATGAATSSGQAASGTATKRTMRAGKSQKQKERVALLNEIIAKGEAPAPPADALAGFTRSNTPYASKVRTRKTPIGLG